MEALLLEILNSAPSWTVGLIYIAFVRLFASQVLGLFSVIFKPDTTRVDRATRRIDELPGDMDEFERSEAMLAIFEEEETGAGCSWTLVVFLSVLLSSVWFIVEVWYLLTGSHNPNPELGEQSLISTCVLSVIWLGTTVLSLRMKRREIDSDQGVKGCGRLLRVVAITFLVGYSVLFYLAPQGLHIYWATVTIGGVLLSWGWDRFGSGSNGYSTASMFMI